MPTVPGCSVFEYTDRAIDCFDFMWQSPFERRRRNYKSTISRTLRAKRKQKNKTARKSRRVNKK